MLVDSENGLMYAGQRGTKEYFWVSRDEGRTWLERAELPRTFRAYAAHEGCPDLHRVEVLPDGLYHVRGLSREIQRVRITDATPIELYCLASGPGNRFATVWIDRGRGWPELMFSQSVDHGVSWSPAVRVNVESRGKEMATPLVVSHGNGWAVIWTENRDARTLFDVYGSLSPDGRRWAPSRRLNDDQEPAFSVGPAVVSDGRIAHVVTQDYRDLNRFHDRDANIYSSGMVLDSDGTVRNVRVNDVTDAPQWAPALGLDARSGSLVAAWVDARRWLTGDMYASTSSDGGGTWSRNLKINGNDRPEVMWRPLVVPRRSGGVYILWQQTQGADTQAFLRLVTFGRQPVPSAETAPAPPRPEDPPIRTLPPSHLVMEERFDTGGIGHIKPLTGSWIVHEGALLAYGYSPTFAEWTGPDLEDFVLEGRFRLDPSQHLSAQFLVRVRPVPGQPGSFEGELVKNHFRMGVFLSHTRFSTGGDPPPALMSSPLDDRWLPFRQDIWYTFRAVVQGTHLDYWIDGERVLSSDLLEPRRGGIVLATDPAAPVEWDDLRLYAFDRSQPASSR